jgi:hypothetical protein
VGRFSQEINQPVAVQSLLSTVPFPSFSYIPELISVINRGIFKNFPLLMATGDYHENSNVKSKSAVSR